MRKRIYVITMLVFILALQCFAPDRALASDYYGETVALIDGSSGRLLFGKEEKLAHSNASTTKLLTCILTLEHMSENQLATISQNAQCQPEVRMGIKEGEHYRLEELLYGLMLESYNDCAVAIAEAIGESEAGFAVMMNDKLKEIGCEDTYFITANGLDAEDKFGSHHSTAYDLCQIMRYCAFSSVKKDEFLQIVQAKEHTVISEEGRSFVCVNHNQFMLEESCVIAGKTGFTNAAGYCYVFAAETQRGEKYCGATLGSGWPPHKSFKWKDARRLLKYGQENFESRSIVLSPGNPQIRCRNVWKKGKLFSQRDKATLVKCNIVLEHNELKLLLGKDDCITQELIINQREFGQVCKGEEVGKYVIRLNDKPIMEAKICTIEETKRWNLKLYLRSFFEEMRMVLSS